MSPRQSKPLHVLSMIRVSYALAAAVGRPSLSEAPLMEELYTPPENGTEKKEKSNLAIKSLS